MMKKMKRVAIAAAKNAKVEQEYKFFYQNHYARKVCIKFYQNPDNPNICSGCGFLEHDHLKLPTGLHRWIDESATWRKELHLVNKCYPKQTLKIRIVDEPASIDRNVDLTILANDVHPSVGLDALLNQWKLTLPDYVISVIGDTHRTPLTPKQFLDFKPGFLNVLSSSRTWVIGGGSLHGVDKVISECVKGIQVQEWMGISENRFNFIAIANWDCFESCTPAGQFYFGTEDCESNYNLDEAFNYFVKKRYVEFDQVSQKLSFTLNPYFTNILGIQGGIKGELHQELQIRTGIENLLSNPNLDNFASHPRPAVPVTVLVIGGDCGDLEHVALSLMNGVPVVICQGSGGIADIIIGALRMSGKGKNLAQYQKFALVKRIRDVINLPKLEDELFCSDYISAVTQLRNIETCVKLQELIVVYRIDKPMIGAKLDQCIIKSLLVGKAARHHDPVSLGLQWGSCDLIFRNILLSEGDINSRNNIRQLCRKALLENKIDFVELFVGLDLDLTRYATLSELMLLYNESIKNKRFLEKLFSSGKTFSLDIVSDVIFQSSGSYGSCGKRTPFSSQQQFSEDRAILELFWWCVFTKRRILSLFFWKRIQNKMASSLIAVSLCKMCQQNIGSNETYHLYEFEEIEQLYSGYACNLLDRVWTFDETFAKLLIRHQIGEPFCTSVFQIAWFTSAGDFISHPGFQSCVEDVWKSNLKYSLPALLPMIIFPFIAANQIRQTYAAKCAFWEAPKIRKTIASPTNTLDEKSRSDMTSLVEMTSMMSSITSFDDLQHEPPLKIGQNGKIQAADSLEIKNGTDITSLAEITSLVSNITSFDDVKNEPQLQIVRNGKVPRKVDSKGNHGSHLSYLGSLAIFYRAPAVKFLIHMLHFMCALPIYSLLFLYVIRSFLISDWEMLLMLCNSCYFIESLDILMKFQGPLKLKFKLWLRSEWNLIQTASSALGILAFALKLIYRQLEFEHTEAAKTTLLYATSVALMWLRFLSFYRCSRRLGPLWIMLRKMMYESLAFMLIFSTISVSAGIFMQVIMDVYSYKDNYSGGWQWLWLRPFFMFSGEHFLKEVSLNSMKTSQERFITYYAIISIVYFFLGNALMLNLLVAIFSEIINKVFVRSDSEFKNAFVVLTREFEDRSIFPPPFILIDLLWRYLKCLVLQLAKLTKREREPNGEISFKNGDESWQRKKKNERNVINYFETLCSNEMLNLMEQKKTIGEIVNGTIKSVDEQHSRLTDLHLLYREIDRLVNERFNTQRKIKYSLPKS